jgi:hypothetical protein
MGAGDDKDWLADYAAAEADRAGRTLAVKLLFLCALAVGWYLLAF